jgi:hypothetical protein
MRRHATSLDPVQAPDTCELIITLKRARGLNIPLYSVKEGFENWRHPYLSAEGYVRRRDFIKGIISSPVVWPFAAHAQQPDRVPRIGVLMNRPADNPEGQARLAAFQEALQQLGWGDGRNMRIDTRWGEDIVDLERKYAAELILALAGRGRATHQGSRQDRS